MASVSARLVTEFLKCRTWRHAWDEIPATEGHGYGEPEWLRCQRCGTERRDEVSTVTGECVWRRYVYPDGYRHAFDDAFADTRPSINDFRRIMLAAHLNQRRG